MCQKNCWGKNAPCWPWQGVHDVVVVVLVVLVIVVVVVFVFVVVVVVVVAVLVPCRKKKNSTVQALAG